jgi:hypothetical protein
MESTLIQSIPMFTKAFGEVDDFLNVTVEPSEGEVPRIVMKEGLCSMDSRVKVNIMNPLNPSIPCIILETNVSTNITGYINFDPVDKFSL